MNALRDCAVMTWRNMLIVRRRMNVLAIAIVQPIMYVLLFAYVFGGSLGGNSYREYLMAGIFAQTVVFRASLTTIGIALDLQKGIVDRFRTLPMSRVAVVLGRTWADLLVNALGLAVMSGCGLLVGWRPHHGLADTALAYGLLLLFAFALSCVGATIGLFVPSADVAGGIGFVWTFPVSFLSSAFVSVSTLPGPLRAFATWNPVTTIADTCRKLFGNPTPTHQPVITGWAADHTILYALAAAVLIIAVALPLAAARYRRVAGSR